MTGNSYQICKIFTYDEYKWVVQIFDCFIIESNSLQREAEERAEIVRRYDIVRKMH